MNITSLKFDILPTGLLTEYLLQVDHALVKKFEALTDSALSISSFSFYTSVSAVFSSKIEGEDIELDSFIKHKLTGAKFLPDFTQKIDDLYSAYEFAQSSNLNQPSLESAHQLITTHILQKAQRGVIRSGNMFVVTKDARIEYVACPPNKVKDELDKLFSDIEKLLQINLDVKQSFFFASLIHLVFVKIHPFNDGNGRTARLLEKWFLAQKIGPKAWFLQSEKFYYDKHNTYYSNIRLLGLEYDMLEYQHALPFLLMLPASLG